MSTLCIIPARGGSKRIPRKNIREFCGKPIIAYSIQAALKSDIFDEVMVSTDDGEISRTARESGAEVPFMRSSLASGDSATTADVLSEVLECYAARGRRFDMICCLYATAPFATPCKLRRAVRMLEEGADSVVSVTPFSFPPQRGFKVANGKLSWWIPGNETARSQDLEPVYHDAGQIYLMRTDRFLEERSLVCGRCEPLVLPETEVQDIDNETDWEIAEMKYERMVARDGKA